MFVLVHLEQCPKRIVTLGRKYIASIDPAATCIDNGTRYGRLMWMHNGGIAEFDKFKRKLQNSLPDELFQFVQGSTDSEWAFALFLSFVSRIYCAEERTCIHCHLVEKSKCQFV